MAEVNGKAVVWREKFPAVIWWDILPKLSRLKGAVGIQLFERLDWPTVIAMVRGTVQSWELDGDPDNVDDIGALDTFNELIPLLNEIGALIQERQPGESPGEAESEPTSRSDSVGG